MDDAWKSALRAAFGKTFDELERTLLACPDALWEQSLWRSTQTLPAGVVLGADRPEAERGQVFSSFWFIAWHTLSCAHYDLEGVAFPAWMPPPPFNELHKSHYLPPHVYTAEELSAYVADTRRKADATVDGLTDESIARVVPVGHRYAGMPYAELLLGCLTHTRDHLAQLEMFLGQRGGARATT
jgi:hypothetical protein